MGRQRQTYSADFRREAVRLTETGTKPLTQIARELGVHPETLRGWTRRYGTGAALVATGSDAPLSLEEENRRLKRENARLLEEREILKKATAFFARDAR